ncbi:MAG TPA: hypothetical protein VEY68_03805 [Anoxybacillus sp.]|nr:hypothetical protein [Anoxybacillus sp.]
MKTFFKFSTIFVMVFVFLFVGGGESAEAKVMWGKVELKKGMIGKITVVKDTDLYSLQKNNQLKVLRKLKKGQEYRVYSFKNIYGGLYSVGGAYVKKTASIKYEPLSKETFSLLIKRSLTGSYEIVSSDGERVQFLITYQKGNKLAGWYFYDPNEPLAMEGEVIGSQVVLRVYFDNNDEQILDSISYLNIPKAELEEIAAQLVDNDDYYLEFHFTIADDPNEFAGQFIFVDLLLDDRYDVHGTVRTKPEAIQVKRID